ncbi:type VI secretion system contractile sheath small subunit [Aliikangiella coralliicola]|uniref:Type VI secretion system contractile sheath small subunit n=1 Tax=Aliikangiella coralliicola TaxID=2592383 RepID=A0A545UGA5_9GAMM|nr:type VI secretion system contractile sheath small subunit [Aliikangiella coralliicola]TQV88501.1 type VI secretion system contractile sheath small subunit [Aliikangiella coralliicola]
MSIQDILPKSRLTLRYRTEISGQPEDIELPLRILMVGDFSGKSTKKPAFQDRDILQFDGKNTNAILEKMKVKVAVQDSEENIHKIPIENVDSFLPSSVCDSIKKMNDMIESKKMLNHLLSSLNNSTKFRNAIKSLVENKQSMDDLKELMAPSYQEKATLPEMLTKQPENA